MKYFRCNFKKRQKDLCTFPSKPFNITVIQVSTPINNVKEAEAERIYDDLQNRLTPKEGCSFYHRGFPDGSDGKASSCNVGDPGSIPGLGRSPEEGNGNPLQYRCLENPMDKGAW